MPACSALQPARTQTHSQFQLGPPEQSQARCSALLWCLMPRYAVLCIQMLSALNPSSITTMDTPSTPLERVHHFWPENNPALPATAARQSGKWGQDPALTTKPQHGASEMLLSMERSPALAPKSGWHRLPACLPAAGSLTPVLHSRQTNSQEEGLGSNNRPSCSSKQGCGAPGRAGLCGQHGLPWWLPIPDPCQCLAAVLRAL